MTRAAALTSGLVTALIVVQVATAEKPVVRYDAEDQAAARAAVLKAADLGSGSKGGLTSWENADPSSCPDWQPRQADLVVTGAARSSFTAGGGVLVISTAVLLQTPQMVQRDWQRTVAAPAALRCLRQSFAAETDERTEFVSATRMAVPTLGRRAARYRVVMNYVDGGRKVPVLLDSVVVGRGRAELTLTMSAPLRDRAAAEAAELRLVRLMLGRLAA